MSLFILFYNQLFLFPLLEILQVVFIILRSCVKQGADYNITGDDFYSDSSLISD